jgi:hypothetical protein
MTDAAIIAHVLVHGYPPTGMPASHLLYDLKPGGWWELSAFGLWRFFEQQPVVEAESQGLRRAMGMQLLGCACLCQNGLTN